MSLQAQVQITDQDIRGTSTSPVSATLGQLVRTSDGRVFAAAVNTSTSLALSPGKMTQGAVSVANHINRTGVTAVAGASTVTFAVGATLVSSNQYAQGYLVVNAGTGAGQALLISGNTSAVSSGSPTVNLADSVITATAASDSKFSLHPHIYSACLISSQAASTTAIPTGVPAISVAAATTTLPGTYFWSQVGGVCSVLANGTIALAAGIIVGATTDGSVDAEGTSAVTPRIGYMIVASVTTEYRPAFLNIS